MSGFSGSLGFSRDSNRATLVDHNNPPASDQSPLISARSVQTTRSTRYGTSRNSLPFMRLESHAPHHATPAVVTKPSTAQTTTHTAARRFHPRRRVGCSFIKSSLPHPLPLRERVAATGGEQPGEGSIQSPSSRSVSSPHSECTPTPAPDPLRTWKPECESSRSPAPASTGPVPRPDRR